MLNRIFSTIGFLSLIALLVSFGGGSPSPVSNKIPARAIAEIPITHHFSNTVSGVGVVGGGSPAGVMATMPSDAGLAISQVTVIAAQIGGGGDPLCVVRIDGSDVWKARLSAGSQYIPSSATIIPPLIVPPGSTIEFGIVGNQGDSAAFTITGYTLDAAYFGGT